MRATHNYKVSVLRSVSRYLLVATALLAGSAAGGIEESRTIRSAVDAFVRAQTETLPGHVEVKSGLVDPQLKFTHCEHLDVFLPPGAKLWGNTTVGVRCEAPEKWSLYVPVQVRVWADVVLSARALPRGQTITADDVAMQRVDLTHLERGVFGTGDWKGDQGRGERRYSAASRSAPLTAHGRAGPAGARRVFRGGVQRELGRTCTGQCRRRRAGASSHRIGQTAQGDRYRTGRGPSSMTPA
jgi:hypothetical protein